MTIIVGLKCEVPTELPTGAQMLSSVLILDKESCYRTRNRNFDMKVVKGTAGAKCSLMVLAELSKWFESCWVQFPWLALSPSWSCGEDADADLISGCHE